MLYQPVVVRFRPDAYAVAEVRGSHWASSDDAARGQQGEAGVFGVVPREITGESDVLWRGADVVTSADAAPFWWW